MKYQIGLSWSGGSFSGKDCLNKITLFDKFHSVGMDSGWSELYTPWIDIQKLQKFVAFHK